MSKERRQECPIGQRKLNLQNLRAHHEITPDLYAITRACTLCTFVASWTTGISPALTACHI